jgi:hypothetical protein
VDAVANRKIPTSPGHWFRSPAGHRSMYVTSRSSPGSSRSVFMRMPHYLPKQYKVPHVCWRHLMETSTDVP